MLVLKLAVRPWRLSPFSQFFSSLAVGFLLLLAGFLFWIQSGLGPVLQRLQHEQVVTAYVGFDVDAKDEGKVVDSIRLAVGAHPDVHLVQSQEFLNHLKGAYPDLGRELQDLGPEMSSVVPRYVSVAGFLPDGALDAIKAVPGIESAESSRDRNAPVIGAFSALRWVARLLAAGLLLAMLMGLAHLSRMNSFLHQDTFALLRLWGAGLSTLILPNVLSGVLVGWAGGVIAGVGWLTGGAWLAHHVRALSPMLKAMPGAPSRLGILLLLAGALIGLASGALGSLTIRTERS